MTRDEQKRHTKGKLKAKKAAQKERARLRRERRKEKREEKSLPKQALAIWAKKITKCGACAVCGKKAQIKKRRRLIVRIRKGNRKGQPVFVPLDAHHILPKEKYPEFRFKKINGICLCKVHHKYGKYSAHRNMIWFAEWLRVNRPEQWAWAIANMGSCDNETC